MPQSAIDFSKYESQAPPSVIDFSKYEASASPKAPDKGAVTRFLEHATGLPVGDILDNPGKYVNVFGHEYWNAAKDNANQPIGPSSARQMIPFGQTTKDASEHGILSPEVAGDVTQGALALTSALPLRRAMPEVMPPRMLPAGPIEMPGEVQASPAPAYSPTTRAQRLNLLLPENAGGKIELPESSLPKESEVSYPGGLNKRPTDRPEIVSDKAIEDSMRTDLERQGWKALSQERKEFFANNGPQMTKGDLVTQARVDAIRAEAEQRVQQVLAEATKPVKFTKTVIPKAKVAAAPNPENFDLNDPNVLINLLKGSLKDLK